MLSSWKEIAHFFGKGVRTVQRWEKTLDLPIHRPPGAPSNVVLARTSDLEEWMHRGPVARVVAGDASAPLTSVPVDEALQQLEAAVRVLALRMGAEAEFAAGGATEDRLVVITTAVERLADIASTSRTARAA